MKQATWAVGRRRLLKLAEHLQKGKLGHKKFNFGVFNQDKEFEQVKPYTCGFMGCGIGECPVVFPRQWKFDREAEPVLKNFRRTPRSHCKQIQSAALFFGIEGEEAECLFVPGEYVPWVGEDTCLPYDATKKQVAKSIRQFVEWKNNGGTLAEVEL